MSASTGSGTQNGRVGRNLIGGDWVDAVNGETLAVINPANKMEIGRIQRSGVGDIDRAVQAAASAFRSWRRSSVRDRGMALLKIAQVLMARHQEIAREIAVETGNALKTQALWEALGAAEIFRYFAGLASEIKGDTFPIDADQLNYTRREPYGVVAAITPWNGPVALAALKIAPAVCAGNTIVLKPAEDASLCVLTLAAICLEALPPGVVNVVTGLGGEAGEALATHPGIAKVSFTGSTEIGGRIMRHAADRIVPVSLELGGKSPCIVFEDADADWAVQGALDAMRFTRQSQSCSAGSRLFVQRTIYESFVERVARKVESLKIGDPLDPDTDIGTVINQKQFERVSEYIEAAQREGGGSLVTGGPPPTEGPLARGFFHLPTIFAGGTNDWRTAREEVFGPVLVAIPFDSEEEVIAMANDTTYGLAGYVFSTNLGRALRTAHAIEAGWVLVNQGGGQQLGHTYGGYKRSGIGREFSLSGMLDSYTQSKNVNVALGR